MVPPEREGVTMRVDRLVLTLSRSAAAAMPVALFITIPAAAQQGPPSDDVRIDADRAASLYVSNRPEDHPVADYEAHIARRLEIERTYEEITAGVVDYEKVTYRSRVGDMDIPAYVFQPLEKRGPHGHAALIWVHGGVHGLWDSFYWPFVKEAVERGYIVIAPEYRGSIGYGEEHHNAIDYGGHEVDDVMTAYDYLVENLPHVDPDRVGMMGWSHGGYITLLSVARDGHPFKAGAAIVPVSNLVFRLSFKGPRYQRFFSTQERIRGLPFERPEIYVERSPVYQVDNIDVPVLVHLATNDTDVNFEEAEMLVHALQVKKPELAETKIYVDPPSGHSFSRRVDRDTLERLDTPEQRDSWNRTWTFLEWNLRPYMDGSRSITADSDN
jgi:dipeptidyl aminopeptidase/acylaminoacyl peptidase